MTGLKPCPCCGDDAKFSYGIFRGYYVECINPDCGIRTPKCRFAYDAMMTWNKRVKE